MELKLINRSRNTYNVLVHHCRTAFCKVLLGVSTTIHLLRHLSRKNLYFFGQSYAIAYDWPKNMKSRPKGRQDGRDKAVEECTLEGCSTWRTHQQQSSAGDIQTLMERQRNVDNGWKCFSQEIRRYQSAVVRSRTMTEGEKGENERYKRPNYMGRLGWFDWR